MDYIRNFYGVPAKKGAKVEVEGKGAGTITGAEGAYVMIRIDGDKHARPYHPTDGIRYLDGVAK